MTFQCFVGTEGMTGIATTEVLPTAVPQAMEREKVRIMVLGSPEGVNSIVLSLHKLRFAEAGEWSHPLPTGRPGEVMRILTKIVLRAESDC